MEWINHCGTRFSSVTQIYGLGGFVTFLGLFCILAALGCIHMTWKCLREPDGFGDVILGLMAFLLTISLLALAFLTLSEGVCYLGY